MYALPWGAWEAGWGLFVPSLLLLAPPPSFLSPCLTNYLVHKLPWMHIASHATLSRRPIPGRPTRAFQRGTGAVLPCSTWYAFFFFSHSDVLSNAVETVDRVWREHQHQPLHRCCVPARVRAYPPARGRLHCLGLAGSIPAGPEGVGLFRA